MPSTALRLAKFFNMSVDFWMKLQMRWDLYHAQQEGMAILKKSSQYGHLRSTPCFRQVMSGFRRSLTLELPKICRKELLESNG
jgi:hypothetical protein